MHRNIGVTRVKDEYHGLHLFALGLALGMRDDLADLRVAAATVDARHQIGGHQQCVALVGLEAKGQKRPEELSGGEQQRVAVALALANDPALILADEPCASLDARTARAVLDEFLAVCRDGRRTLIVVSHDEAALRAADRVIAIADVNRAAAA